jgi:hypothetical protein
LRLSNKKPIKFNNGVSVVNTFPTSQNMECPSQSSVRFNKGIVPSAMKPSLNGVVGNTIVSDFISKAKLPNAPIDISHISSSTQ